MENAPGVISQYNLDHDDFIAGPRSFPLPQLVILTDALLHRATRQPGQGREALRAFSRMFRSRSPADDAALNPAERRRSAADQVYDAIIHGLRTGAFIPGQNLVEPDLVNRLGVSRGPVREGLKLLEAAGIVVWNPHRGASIGELDVAAVLDLLQALEPLSRLAARLAALHCASAADQKRMKDVAARIALSGASGNRADYLDARQRFYDTMIDIGGNRELA